MKKEQNIFLIGPMGAGKTTVGRQLAKGLGVTFYDSDHEIETRTGAGIPLIFEYEGEQGFRRRECSMIDELTRMKGIVLATGGGAILGVQNRENLKNRGFIVYLKCTVDCQLKRTRKDRNRPLLHTDNPKKKLNELSIFREPLYLECADHIVDTDRWSTRHVVKDILEAFAATRMHSKTRITN